MKKQWKRLAALSSAAVMAAGTLLYFPTDTLQNISWGITASAEETGAGTESGSQTWNEGDLTWTLDAEGTMTISGTGAMKNYDTDYSPATQKKDNVEKVVIQEGITSIGNYAFYNCSNLASIEIPEGVTSIGNYAFYNCSSLTSIEIPSSVTSIGNGAFAGCGKLTSIEIPSGVTNIGDNAFYDCTGLESIEIPSGVTNIGDNAFSDCTGLKSITIPSSVTSIGVGVFDGCTALKEVLLENGSELTYNDLGVSESIIRTYWNEDNLTWTLTADGTMTISGSGAMQGYRLSDSPATQKEDSVKKVVIENGITSIGAYAFSGCNKLEPVDTILAT